MAASLNKVLLMGNLTRDPEVKYLPSGTSVCDLGLAVNERYKDSQSGEWKEKATFIDVTVWGRSAENAGKYLSKGRPVLIEGRLQLDQWDGPQGEKRSKLKVVAESVQFLSGGRSEGGSYDSSAEAPERPSSSAAPSAPAQAAPMDDEEDLPF